MHPRAMVPSWFSDRIDGVPEETSIAVHKAFRFGILPRLPHGLAISREPPSSGLHAAEIARISSCRLRRLVQQPSHVCMCIVLSIALQSSHRVLTLEERRRGSMWILCRELI